MKLQLSFVNLLGLALVAVAQDGLSVVETRSLGDGTLTVYGVPAIRGGATALAACSGADDVTCGGSHQAPQATCNTLINEVCSSGASLSSSPRAICLSQSGSQCCISWSADIGAIPANALCSAARKTVSVCNGNVVSALARNVNLNGGCVTECISNRASGCS